MLLVQELQSRAFDQLVESLLTGGRAQPNSWGKHSQGGFQGNRGGTWTTKYGNDIWPDSILVRRPLLGARENICLTTEWLKITNGDNVTSWSFCCEWVHNIQILGPNKWTPWVSCWHFHIVRRPLKEAFLASKIVILDYFSRELPFSRGEIDNSRLF